jgi:FUN14 domain-containing protein 1
MKRSKEGSEGNDSGDSLAEFVIIDAVPKSSLDNLTEKIFGDITKASACKQIGIGGTSGWVAGYLANKIGKMAAVGIVSSLVLFQIAQHNGYITVDWTKVQHVLTSAQARTRRSIENHRQSLLLKGQTFYEENFFLASGFTAGFLVGFIW